MNTRESGKASSSLGLQDFDLLRVIGRGSYAKVLLVRLKKTDRIYAMKVVKKELVNDDEVSVGLGVGGDGVTVSRQTSRARDSWCNPEYHTSMYTCTRTHTHTISVFVGYFLGTCFR
jgi:serine/threonine protein kinase